MFIDSRSSLQQRGGYIVILAVIIVVLISLLGFIFASNFLSSNKSVFQNAANFSSLGALERFVRVAPGDTSPNPDQDSDGMLTYQERAAASLDRANRVFDEHSLLGHTASGNQSLGHLGYESTPGPGGAISFGNWYPAPVGSDPCTGNYPCYVPASSQPNGGPLIAPAINAIRISAKTPHPFLTPFSSFLGVDLLTVSTESIAAVVPRCTVLVLDASSSTVEENFLGQRPGGNFTIGPPPSGQSPPSFRVVTPRPLSLFAYEVARLGNPSGSPNMSFDPQDPDYQYPYSPCQDGSHYIYSSSPDASFEQGQIWCSMSFYDGAERHSSSPDSISNHYPDRYFRRTSRYGLMLVELDTNPLRQPQPLVSFLLGFNAAARLMDSARTQADGLAVMAFKNDVIDRFPTSGFTTDRIGAITQMTNYDNVGIPPNPEVHPNLLDRGWFPLYVDPNTGSNVTKSLQDAINALADPDQCPAYAKKSIILASDGITNCWDTINNSLDGPDKNCVTDLAHYAPNETLLLDTNPNSGVLGRLLSNRIALTVFLAGNSVRPHILNRRHNGSYIDYTQAQALGYSGLPLGQDPASHSNLLTDSRTIIDDDSLCQTANGGDPCDLEDEKMAYALENIDRPTIAFRRPSGVFAELALRTGGIFCPLVPRGPGGPVGTSIYTDRDGDGQSEEEDVLLDSYRDSIPEGTPLHYNIQYLTQGQYAGTCAQLTLGLNPFILVQER